MNAPNPNWSRRLMRVVGPLLLFPLVMQAQVLVGHEVALFPLYMIAVAQMSWWFGMRGLVLSVALAVGFWLWGSVLSGQHFSDELFRYYNALVRGLVFALCGVAVVLFRRTLETHRARMEAMRAMLNVCHGCGAVQGSDGQWVPIEALLARADSTSRPLECPGCTHQAAVAAPRAPLAAATAR